MVCTSSNVENMATISISVSSLRASRRSCLSLIESLLADLNADGWKYKEIRFHQEFLMACLSSMFQWDVVCIDFLICLSSPMVPGSRGPRGYVLTFVRDRTLWPQRPWACLTLCEGQNPLVTKTMGMSYPL